MLQGLKSPGKQFVSNELTGADMHKLVMEAVNAAEHIGLFKVRASTSDMGSSNKAMWVSLGVSVTRKSKATSYRIGNGKIHALADVPHLIKNMRRAFLTRVLTLPLNIQPENDLPSGFVNCSFLKQMGINELDST